MRLLGRLTDTQPKRGQHQSDRQPDGQECADDGPADAVAERYLCVGGVAIKANGVAVGGIGVSGAPGGNFDEECALSALDKIQDRLK
jgi:uncharacterized protein GlcG (DUF336 family)